MPQDAKKYSEFKINIDSKEAFETIKIQAQAASHLGIMEIEVIGGESPGKEAEAG